ncbi:MAG: alpha/beta hydrolase [Polyangiaceae bacterium]
MSQAISRVLIVPRWSGTPTSDCYPWLTAALARRFGEGLSVTALSMPDPGTPRLDTWPPALLAAAGDDRALLRQTLFVGHSVGCQTVLRALASMPDDITVGGALLIAGWFTVDKPWATIQPWIQEPCDLARARARTPWLEVLVSDNDPFTADFEKTARDFRERTRASVTIHPGAKHFNAPEEPAVLSALTSRIESSMSAR